MRLRDYGKGAVMVDEVVRLNRLLGKYSGEVRHYSEELLRLSDEIMFNGTVERTDKIIYILVALKELIESAETVSEIKNNEIYDDLGEWLNENG